jgi:hypothetical protein
MVTEVPLIWSGGNTASTPVRAAVLGKVVHHENPRAVEVQLRMHQALAVLRRHPQGFGGAERLFIERDRGIGVADDEMRRDNLNCGHFKLLNVVSTPHDE